MDDFEFGDLFMKESGFTGPPVESDTSNLNSGIFCQPEEYNIWLFLPYIMRQVLNLSLLHKRKYLSERHGNQIILKEYIIWSRN